MKKINKEEFLNYFEDETIIHLFNYCNFSNWEVVLKEDEKNKNVILSFFTEKYLYNITFTKTSFICTKIERFLKATEDISFKEEAIFSGELTYTNILFCIGQILIQQQEVIINEDDIVYPENGGYEFVINY